MSLSKIIDVWCDADDCHKWTEGSTNGSVIEARIRAKQAGWVRRSIGGKMLDLCPGCAGSSGSQENQA